MTAPTTPRCYRHPDREAHVRCTRCDRPICPACMREASVGFHCPDDVAQARRTIRAPRTTVGAVLRNSPSWVTIALIAINVAIFLYTGLSSPRGLNEPDFTRLFQDWQLQPFAVHREGSYYRLLTAGFLHANVLHVGVNMLSLGFIGFTLEPLIGRGRFIAVYLISLLGGSTAIYLFGSPAVPVIGASGAIFGLVGACLVMARQLRLDVQWLVMIIVINFAFTFSVAGISKLGHVGGFITGALAGVAIGGLPHLRRRVSPRIQAAGLGGLLALLVVLVAIRSATGSF